VYVGNDERIGPPCNPPHCLAARQTLDDLAEEIVEDLEAFSNIPRKSLTTG
jgi:hypothetical protein